MADIISLAERRQRKVDAPSQLDMDLEKALTFRLFAQIKRNLGLPPDYRGEWMVTRRPPPQNSRPPGAQ